MYLSIERNTKGNLEIDDIVINEQVEFIVKNKVKGVSKIMVNVGIHNENTIFITVKLKVTDRASFFIDVRTLTEEIDDVIYKTLLFKPKKVSFAYIH